MDKEREVQQVNCVERKMRSAGKLGGGATESQARAREAELEHCGGAVLEHRRQ